MFRKIIITVTALALTVFYFYHDPSARSFGPRCLIHQTTGWYCWGCGGQRAFHALLHGNFIEALKANLLIYLTIPIFMIVLYTEWRDDKRLLYYLRRRWISLPILVFVVVFTIVRNLPFFVFLRP